MSTVCHHPALTPKRPPRTDPDTWKGRYWKRTEIDTLLAMIDQGCGYATIAKRLGRTKEAVMIKAERLSYRLLNERAALTCRAVQRRLGLTCSKTVARWISTYGLKARNAGTKAKPLWRIQEEDLLAWLEDRHHWMAYDPANVPGATLREHLTEIRHRQPRWLTPGEVARRFHVDPGTVASWRDKGLLSMTRYGNWWVWEVDLVGFVPPCERAKSREGV